MSAPEVPTVDLSQINLSSALSAEGLPFLEIEVVGDGTVLYGQMLPDQVRTMAMDWLVAAEAADQDALVFRVLVEDVDLAAEEAANTVGLLRRARAIAAGIVPDEIPNYAGATIDEPAALPDWAADAERARILAEQDDDLG